MVVSPGAADSSAAAPPPLPTRRPRSRRSTPPPRFALVISWLLLGFIVLLLGFIVYMSFVPGLPTDGGWTLDNWSELRSRTFLTRVLPNTAIIGFGSVTLAALFGLPIAWLVNRTDLPGRRLIATAMALVLVVPGYVAAMGWTMLVDEHIGVLNALVGAIFRVPVVPISVSNNIAGITWVIGIILAPAVFFLLSGPLHAIDSSMGEAARMSGATPWQAFWRIDAPLIWPAILSALIYIFITAVSIFEIPALIGGGTGNVPVLSTTIFYAVRPAGVEAASFTYGVAGVYGIVLAAPCLIALYFYLRLLDRAERYQTVTGKGYRLHRTRLRRLKYVGVAFVFGYFALSLLLPLAVLLWTSLLPIIQVPSIAALSKLGWSNYNDLIGTIGGPSVIWNTIWLVVIVSVLVPMFSMLISWIVTRTKLRARKAMDVLSMVPHAVPGLAFAFALTMIGIVAARWIPWLPLRGTLALIVIADMIQRLPFGTRLTNGALVQIHAQLEEAARMSGASSRNVLMRVLLPLVRPSIVYLGVWTALLTVQEVSMALFLSGPQNNVLSVSIFQLWNNGNIGQSAAASVVLTVVLGLATWIVLRLFGNARVGLSE